MNTNDMPEEELDDLFRQAAAGHHPEYDPQAWEAMERKLDGRAVPTPTNWRWWGGLTLLLLFMGISTWWGYTHFTRDKSENQNTALNQIRDNQFKTSEKKDLKPGVSAEVIVPPITPASPVLKSDILANKANLKSPIAAAITRNRPMAKTPTASTTIIETEENQIITDTTKTQKTIIVEGAEPTDTSNNTTNAIVTADSTATKILPFTGTLLKDSSQVIITKTNDSTDLKKSLKALALNRFTFSVMAAPDLSTVGFTNLGGISTNAGFTIGYNFTTRWSLATGIIKARKIYDAKPGDYGNKYYWYNRHLPDDIAAVCRVLDIPVNLGYNIWQRGKSVLTLQTGLSSYFMLDEKYTYEYYAPNPYTTVWQVDEKNKNLFSIYNLSARYGWQLSPSLGIGVEPFVKVPLAGVGAGKIKLASAGVFFSLSYRHP